MGEDNQQIVLAEIPQGKLAPEHFKAAVAPRPTPGEGEVLLKILYVSLDAANRAWMQGATYRSALSAGDVMAGGALAEVVESRSPDLAPGDLVFADTGWQAWAVAPAGHLAKLPRMEPLTHLLSVYGVAGLTAYFGLLECGRPRPGETVVVSAAAGAVGSLVGQIARIKGCRSVGIAGGAAKCALLTHELGFDAAVDYKAGDTRRALRARVRMASMFISTTSAATSSRPACSTWSTTAASPVAARSRSTTARPPAPAPGECPA